MAKKKKKKTTYKNVKTGASKVKARIVGRAKNKAKRSKPSGGR